MLLPHYSSQLRTLEPVRCVSPTTAIGLKPTFFVPSEPFQYDPNQVVEMYKYIRPDPLGTDDTFILRKTFFGKTAH